MSEMTPDQLAAALRNVPREVADDMNWPYIDEFVIDGQLEPLVKWLCETYRIQPRP